MAKKKVNPDVLRFVCLPSKVIKANPGIDFLMKLGEESPGTRGWIVAGLEHGYPVCCIFWFASVWAKLCLMNEAESIYQEYMRLVKEAGSDYIPCPACLVKALKKKGV